MIRSELKLPESDLVEHTRETCKFIFEGICAAHDSLYGYGGTITDFNMKCRFWKLSNPAYEKALKIKQIAKIIIEGK